MGSLALIVLALLGVIVIALPMVQGVDESPQAVEEWYKMRQLGLMKETETKIHFYMHVTVQGDCITGVPVTVGANQTRFGSILVTDSPLTVGADPNSMLLGEAQGTYTGTAIQEESLLVNWNLVFTSGEYNGSTLCIFGQSQVNNIYREMSVVGGSGVFRLARGTATSQTYSFNATPLNFIIEYDVIVIHYCMI